MRESGSTPMKYVYRFSEGNTSMANLLVGKGANLADMAQLGLPVPPGFTITSEACRDYYRHDGQLTIARLATAQAAPGDGQREDI